MAFAMSKLPFMPFMLFVRLVAMVGVIATLASCGSATDSDAPSSWPPPPPAAGIQLKIGPFELAPGDEIHKCVTYDVQDTMLINRIESFSTLKSHHFAADVTVVPLPEGTHDCRDIFTEAVMQSSMTVYSTDRQQNRIDFPDGVAGKLPAQFAKLILSFHVVNPSSKPINVEGYINLHTTEREKVHALINGIVGSVLHFSLPPRADTTLTGTCTVDRPIDVIAMTGHAHQRLSSFELRLIHGGTRPQQPDYQTHEWSGPPLDAFTDKPVHMNPGDSIEWRCSYRNESDAPVTDGEKTSQEMCMVVVVYMPDQGFLTCNVTPAKPQGKVRQQTPPGQLD
jgi:hypothetical protein